MTKKLILRLSNNLGNQMFMYASAFALSKMLNRELFMSYQNTSILVVDDEADICEMVSEILMDNV